MSTVMTPQTDTARQNMTPDELSAVRWNENYDIKASTLWGEPPVPYASEWLKHLTVSGPVLDMPCGDGRNIVPLRSNDRTVLGADTSINALRIARCRLDQLDWGAAITLLQQDAFATSFVDNTFAAVFCWDLLGHLRDPEAPITELLRIVRPGGLVVGSVFSTGDSTRGKDMRKIEGEEYMFAERFYFRFYNRGEVEKLIDIPGTDLVSLEKTSWMEPPHEGYREYEHMHESWAFVLRKR